MTASTPDRRHSVFFAALLAAILASSAYAAPECSRLFSEKLGSASAALARSDAAGLEYLARRYGIDPADVRFTAEKKYPVIIRGTGQDTLRPAVDLTHVVRDPQDYDVVIVGGGPAGMTSALYLGEQGKKVLILEREAKLGGLGAGSELQSVRAGGGAAYSAGPDGKKQYRIFQHIGLGNYKKKLSIHEPIDSYLWNGKMYLGVWEEHALEELPASFALFRHALEDAEARGLFKIDTAAGRESDKIDFATFVRRMPEMVSQMKDKESRAIYERFLKDEKVPRDDPMKNVIELLELYGRSALGGTPDQISARQFGDFYAAELYTRYTGTLGTGDVTEAIQKKLARIRDSVATRTSAPVAKIENGADGAVVTYVHEGQTRQVRAKKVVFAAPIKLAPRIIQDFEKDAAERAGLIRNIQMTDYAVHIVRVKGHPFRETYDLWVRPQNYRPDDPTDFIVGRWMDPKIRGYEGMRSFQKDPGDDYGVLTVYHPIGDSGKTRGFNETEALARAEQGVDKLKEILEPYLQEKFGKKIEIELVESHRWPYSIHIVSPGSLERNAVLAEPLGNIHFANNTLGAPELEEALERGHDVALALLKELREDARRRPRSSPPLRERAVLPESAPPASP